MSLDAVQIIKSSNSLKARIGTPLSLIFTYEKMRAAQEIFDRGHKMLAEECKADLQELREICRRAMEDPLPTDSGEIIRLTSNIKGCGYMAGYPMVSTMADILMSFLSEINPHMDARTLSIAITLTDAINAVFVENRRNSSDPVGDAIVSEVKRSIRDYLLGKK